MEFLFIQEDRFMSFCEEIPESILEEHAAGVTTIINVKFGGYLDDQNEWQEIPVIPVPPLAEDVVRND